MLIHLQEGEHVKCILQPQGNFKSLKLVKITGGTEVTNYMY